MDKYKFGEFIYTQRKRLGFTQDDLGRKLNVTNKAVSKWETGETLPDIQLLPKLASVLNVTIDELLTQTKPEAEKVYVDPKKNTRIILWIACSILCVICICLSLVLFRINEKANEDVFINLENATEYFEITPCLRSVADGDGIDIYGSIIAKKDLVDAVLVLDFTIQYYYINGVGELSEVVYVDRYVSFDPLDSDFSLILRPKGEIDKKSFHSVVVSYEIVEVSGKVVN